MMSWWHSDAWRETDKDLCTCKAHMDAKPAGAESNVERPCLTECCGIYEYVYRGVSSTETGPFFFCRNAVRYA